MVILRISLQQMEKKMNVTELSSYGQAFDHMPAKAQILQMKVMFSELVKKFGVFGTFGFIAKIVRVQNQLKKKYSATIAAQFADVPASAIMEMYMMTAMYLALAEGEDKEKAYEFVKSIFQKIGPTAHETLYNLKGLLQCEGDVYTNFCQLNRSIFESSAQKGFYDIAELQDSENLQFIRLTKCLNVDAFSALGCPELARLGCDIDIAGYAPEAMGDKVNLDFRRPGTIAKGSPACEFYYFRQGHAPADMETV
jgi:hypothetical protein